MLSADQMKVFESYPVASKEDRIHKMMLYEMMVNLNQARETEPTEKKEVKETDVYAVHHAECVNRVRDEMNNYELKLNQIASDVKLLTTSLQQWSKSLARKLGKNAQFNLSVLTPQQKIPPHMMKHEVVLARLWHSLLTQTTQLLPCLKRIHHFRRYFLNNVYIKVFIVDFWVDDQDVTVSVPEVLLRHFTMYLEEIHRFFVDVVQPAKVERLDKEFRFLMDKCEIKDDGENQYNGHIIDIACIMPPAK